MKKIKQILINAIPVLLMIGLIPLISNDYWLTLAYIIFIVVSLVIATEKNDLLIFVFGFFVMIIFEYVFTSTGVEVFQRNSLFNLMPLWLPFLWGYGFIVIKRSIIILDSN